MIRFSGCGLLLDVEGTTSSVSYVYDVLFPYARRELTAYLTAHWGEPGLEAVARQVARDAGHDSWEGWVSGLPPDEQRQRLADEIIRQMDADVKATGLKQLQGMIWKAGFERGQLEAHVFADVPPALAAWRRAGRQVRIYSSGSVQAQRLFFAHTEQGDLLPHLGGHYDTTTGPKREPASYVKIADDWSLAPGEILFLSDVPEELDAAAEAGMQTGLCLRPGNAPVDLHGQPHATLASFDEVELV